MKNSAKQALIALLDDAGTVFKQAGRRTKILTALAWMPNVAEEFFRRGGNALPKPEYFIDRDGIEDTLDALDDIEPRLRGDHPVLKWLRETRESFANGLKLLLAVETDAFFEYSSRLYGTSATKPFEGMTSNLELARAIAGRVAACDFIDIEVTRAAKTAKDFAHQIERMLLRRHPGMNIAVEVTDQIAAKVAAGMGRVRVRIDANFSELELRSLWSHEIESHCLTAHNGAAQEHCDFLAAGGPRATLAQEGLAVFTEIYGHTMSQNRFITLCNRVEAVALVEQGADFMELYRWYQPRSANDREAFLSAQRIFRGAPLKGRLPFTKDVVYLAGLVGVFNYLRLAVKNQNRILVETLVDGRMALEDVPTIAWLRAHGVISPPKYLPEWLKNWEGLLTYFSFTSFMGTLDLAPYQNYFTSHHSLQEWDLSI